MEPIYPVTALQKKQGEVKEAARKGIVRITENGAGAFVFCSEEVYEQKMKEVADQAAYETLVAAALERGFADIEAERCYEGAEVAREAALKLRRKHA